MLVPQLVTLPDHTWWAYGAWARWYRWHPADGRWFPCPTPRATAVRGSARAARPGLAPPPVAMEILPAGPDLGHGLDPPLAITGGPVSGALAYRLRQVVAQAALAPVVDYPLGWGHFLHGTPSTVAATWSTMLWCASVPLFDAGADAGLLELWQPYLAQRLTGDARLRWLTPPPLATVVGLYADRLRAGRPDTAGQIARCMVMTAQALREDPRFETKATALLSMLEPVLSNPAVDQPALPYGDQAMELHWSIRCPAHLAPVLFADTAPGPRFQLAFYDLAEALEPMCGDPEDADFVEPRHAAVALLAADMAGYRPDLATPVGDWLDPELRTLLAAILQDPEHALRRLWPAPGTAPTGLRPATAGSASRPLSAAAALDFAWCRLAGGVPVPAEGFPVPDALAAMLGGPGGGPGGGDAEMDGGEEHIEADVPAEEGRSEADREGAEPTGSRRDTPGEFRVSETPGP
jgi:hypothetical protein